MQAYALTPTIDWPGSGPHVVSCSSNADGSTRSLGPEDRGMAERAERRLTTILAADVAGYSRLMRADEDGTLAALTASTESPAVLAIRPRCSAPSDIGGKDCR